MLRDRDAEFRRGWGRALVEGFERLELLLLSRAIAAASGEAPPADAAPARMQDYSDRVALSLLSQHRAAVERLRAEEGVQEDGPATDMEALRAKLLKRLETMRVRMAGTALMRRGAAAVAIEAEPSRGVTGDNDAAAVSQA